MFLKFTVFSFNQISFIKSLQDNTSSPPSHPSTFSEKEHGKNLPSTFIYDENKLDSHGSVYTWTLSYITKNLGGKTKPNDLSKGLFRQVCYTQ